MKNYLKVCDFHSDKLTQMLASDDLNDKLFQTKIIYAIYRGKLSFNDAKSIIETKKPKLIAFEDIGYPNITYNDIAKYNPLYVGLTWNGENQFGGGVYKNIGLTNLGKSFCRQAKFAIDTAHISKIGFIDIIDNAKAVVNSHTAFCGVNRHARNLEDWQIKLIIEKQGLIGICFVSSFLTNKTATYQDVVKHIDYFVQKFGIYNLALGTDFYGTCDLPIGLKNYHDIENISNKLINMGYLASHVEKILYSNLNNFINTRR